MTTEHKPHSDLLARLRYRAQLGRMAGVEWQEMGQATQTALYGIAADLEEIADGLEEQLEATERHLARDRKWGRDMCARAEDAEEQMRLIAEAAGADGTSPDDWRALLHKWDAALNAVVELRRDYDEAIGASIPAKQPYVYSGDVNDPGPNPAKDPLGLDQADADLAAGRARLASEVFGPAFEVERDG